MSEAAVIDTPITSPEMKGQLLPELFKAAQANEARQQQAADQVNRPDRNQIKADPSPVEPIVKDEPAKETPEKKTPLKVNKSNPMESLRSTTTEQKETPSGEVDQAAIDAAVDSEFSDDSQNKPGGWKSLKTSLKSEKARAQQFERTNAQLRQELESLKKNPVTSEASPDIEALRKEYEELKGANAIAAWQTSKEYKEGILTPLNKAYGYVDGLAKKYEISEHEIGKALQAENRFDRNEILDGLLSSSSMSATNQRDFLAAIDQIYDLEAKKAEGFSKANELYQATLANRNQEAEQMTKAQMAELTAASKDALKSVRASEGFSDIVDESTWGEYEGFVQEYLTTPSVRTPQLDAYNVAAGYLLPNAQEKIIELQKELASYKESLKKYSNGGPAAGAGSVTSTTDQRQGPASMSDVGRMLGEATRGLRGR